MTRDNELRALRGVVQTYTREGGRTPEQLRIALRTLWPQLAETLDMLTFDANPGDPEDVVARQVVKDYLAEYGDMTVKGITHGVYENRPGPGTYKVRPKWQSRDVHVPGCSSTGDRYHEGPCTVKRGRTEEDGEVHAPPVPEVEVQGRSVPVTSYARVVRGMCRKLELPFEEVTVHLHRYAMDADLALLANACTTAGLPVPDEDERPTVLSAISRYAKANRL